MLANFVLTSQIVRDIAYVASRCKFLTSMMTKNPIRRFARCKRFEIDEGCYHFKLIDDAFCDRLRSMLIALMIQNETFGNDINKL